MEKIHLDDNQNLENRNPNSIDDLNENIARLLEKIDTLTIKIDNLEEKLNNLQYSDKSPSKNEVEIEEQNELDEDYLTPSDLVFENEPLRITGTKLIKLRIATASEIAKITGKDRAVESFYLNDLWSRNKIRKLRIGRRVYFYAGKASEIKPFKNSKIKSEWRELLVSIIQNIDSFETTKKISLSKIIETYYEKSHSDDSSNTKVSSNDYQINPTKLLVEKKELELQILEKLMIITEQSSFLKLINKNPNEIKVEFIGKEWINFQ